jgi:hypothetical protein
MINQKKAGKYCEYFPAFSKPLREANYTTQNKGRSV